MVFITLSKLVPGKGPDFVDALRQQMIDAEQMPDDVKLLSAFVTYGQYDLVMTLEAPDLKRANEALKDLLTSGVVTTETLVGQSIDEFVG